MYVEIKKIKAKEEIQTSLDEMPLIPKGHEGELKSEYSVVVGDGYMSSRNKKEVAFLVGNATIFMDLTPELIDKIEIVE